MQNAHAFVAELNKQFEAKMPGVSYRPVFFVTSGPAYDKIIHRDASRVNEKGSTVFCFVNASGEVFKAAGWAKPAKGVRALLSDITPEFVAKIVDAGYATTGWLYR
jgi:hypothetical protein